MDITEQVLHQTAGNLYWKDKNGFYLGCNANMASLFNLKHLSDIVGKNDYDFFLDDLHVKKIIENDKLVITSGKEIEFEEIGADKSGKLVTYKTKKVPLRDKENNIIGVIGISIDITKEKEAEVAKIDFISNIEHDLRTPFAGISGIATTLYEIENNPEKKEMLSLLVKSCIQWEDIQHHILAALSIKEPQTITKQRFSLTEELAAVKDMLAATAHLKNLELSIEPIPAELDEIETDKLKVRLILSSLVGNAIKFTKKGFVRVVTVCDAINYKIQVIDTGIGIPNDRLDYIFEQFTKLARSNKYGGDFKGVGLGLYISRHIAEELGGTITVASNLGKGSTFTLTLPFRAKS